MDNIEPVPEWTTNSQGATINGIYYTIGELCRKFPFPEECKCGMWGTPYGHFIFYKEFGGHLDSIPLPNK